MLNIRMLDQRAKPRTLCLGIAGTEGANVWRECVLQSRRALHEFRNVSDLDGKQGIQEIVLDRTRE